MIDVATITATIAGICMAICQVPQAWRVYKTNKTDDISTFMQALLCLGIGMWFVTGLLLSNAPMYLSNGFCLVFCLYILWKCLSAHSKK